MSSRADLRLSMSSAVPAGYTPDHNFELGEPAHRFSLRVGDDNTLLVADEKTHLVAATASTFSSADNIFWTHGWQRRCAIYEGVFFFALPHGSFGNGSTMGSDRWSVWKFNPADPVAQLQRHWFPLSNPEFCPTHPDYKWQKRLVEFDGCITDGDHSPMPQKGDTGTIRICDLDFPYAERQLVVCTLRGHPSDCWDAVINPERYSVAVLRPNTGSQHELKLSVEKVESAPAQRMTLN